MERKYIAIGIFVVCVLCLIVGLFSPMMKQKSTNVETGSAIMQKKMELSGAKIALLNIEGAISSDLPVNAWSNVFSTVGFIDGLEKAKTDSNVKAILIRINSPGGTVAASQDIYDAILRARKEKPVVASMADMAASGGYYAASAADRIVAQKGTMTGSIGVIFNFMDVADLADKLGITSNVIKSGKFKDSGSMYRKMSSDEQELFQSSVNNAYKQFIEAIESARVNRKDMYKDMKELNLKTLKKYADGRVFLGDEAYELGFVDKLGSQYDAQILASEMAGYDKTLPVVSYNKSSAFNSFLTSLEGKLFPAVNKVLPFSYTHSSRPLLIWE